MSQNVKRVIIYKPSDIFEIFIENGSAEIYADDQEYSKDDLIICPVFWGLNSLDQFFSYDFKAALENMDNQGCSNPLITDDIKAILKKNNAKLLLYNHWEARNLDSIKSELLYFTRFFLKQPFAKVLYSTCNYAGHMAIPKNPLVISYDWMHLGQKLFYKPEDVIKNKKKKCYPILSLNYRGNAERYAYCYYLFQKHRSRALFSYLDYPADDDAKEINNEYKSLLKDCYSKESHAAFNSAIPVKIDGPLPAKHQTQTLKEIFKLSYVHVMFETNCLGMNSAAQQVSEKSYINIRVGKPFIIFTTKGGILKHLKSLGYRTFSPYINEDYDDPNCSYHDRFKALLKETDRICGLSQNELDEMDLQLNEVVEYNVSHFVNNNDVPNFFDMINEKRLRNPLNWIHFFHVKFGIFMLRFPFWGLYIKPVFKFQLKILSHIHRLYKFYFRT